jgi:hypothetical protein
MSGLIRVLKAAVATGLLIAFAATPASAVTVRDLLNLKAAGLSDEILIALIQTDGSVFYLTADEIISLSKQGLSERVLLAMIDTARKPQPVLPPVALPAEASEYQQLAQPPVTLHVSQVNEQYVEQPQGRYADYPMTYPIGYPLGYPIAVPVFISSVDRVHGKDVGRREPVYWGFGGQRRPDSWDARPAATAPPARKKR